MGMHRASWRQILVPEMPGTTLEISKLGMDDRTTNKNWKTNTYMGLKLANTNVLPMAMFGKMERDSNADRCVDDTYIRTVVGFSTPN